MSHNPVLLQSHIIHSFPNMVIENFSVNAHLGCSAEEQALPQEVQFTVLFGFPVSPQGEITDQLADTLCYAEVCKTLEEVAKSQHFQLIEKIAFEGLSALSKKFPEFSIQLTIHKLHPPVKNLKGGVKYTCQTPVTQNKKNSKKDSKKIG